MKILKVLLVGTIISSLHVSLCTGSIFTTAVALAADAGTEEEAQHFCDALRMHSKEEHQRKEHKCEGNETCLFPMYRHGGMLTNHNDNDTPTTTAKSVNPGRALLNLHTSENYTRAGPLFEHTREHVNCLVKRE